MTIYRYVNLDRAKAEHRSCNDGTNQIQVADIGREIRLKAVVQAQNGERRWWRRVVFEMRPDPQNVVPPGGQAPQTKRKTVLTDLSGEATTTFKVSKYAGDKYKIAAYLPSNQEQKLIDDECVVRQRVYYQLSRYQAANVGGVDFPAIPAIDMAAAIDEFSKDKREIHFIDDSRRDTIPRGPEIITKGLDYPPLAKIGYDKKREPASVRIVLVNQIADVAEQEATGPFGTAKIDASDEIVGLPGKVFRAPSGAFPNNEDWCVEARWIQLKQQDGHDPPDEDMRKLDFDMDDYAEHGNWTALDKSKLTVGANHVTIANDAIGVKLAKVRIKYRVVSSATNGTSLCNTVFVAYRGNTQEAEARRKATLVHELGHFIGMVRSDQASHYVEHGHKGPHCSTGLSGPDKAKPSYKDLNGTCVMFGEDADSRLPTFCVTCEPSIRKCFVQIAPMPPDWLT